MPRTQKLLALTALGALVIIGFATYAGPGQHDPAPHEAADTSQPQTNDPLHLTEAALLGRWESPTDQDAYVEFVAFGLWVASDGCSSLTGTWWIDDEGELHAGSNGKKSEATCEGVDVPHAVMNAQSTVLDDYGNLVFVDQAGTRTALVPGS